VYQKAAAPANRLDVDLRLLELHVSPEARKLTIPLELDEGRDHSNIHSSCAVIRVGFAAQSPTAARMIIARTIRPSRKQNFPSRP
jgi:hypothetical protein